MKKIISLLLTCALGLALFSGCSAKSEAPAGDKKVEITVVTSYGGDDGNRINYETAYKAYEAATGNIVRDASGTSNEEWKAKIMTDFETGSEPDVLFYFNGVDANKLVENGKVVSIDEIRTVYPDYASNMKDDALGASPVDGVNYSVPVNGYWEGLYVNKKVLADCGVAVPGADYTWDQFLADCQVIADKGYVPIACSLQEVPHYWFEFTVLNNGSLANHTILPTSGTDAVAQIWSAGLNDMKELYERGFFPKNTTTAGDSDTFQLMADNQAAFAIDGSWKMGWFEEYAQDINDFTVTFVPAKGERKATDLIGGLSMGYYITKKAWDNPEKQAACVEFVKAMTTDEVVNTFGATAVTALKNGTTPPADANALVTDALAMTKTSTSVIAAAQDGLNQTARTALFTDIKNVILDTKTAEQIIDSALALNQ